jgi:hypothetical protein
MPVILRVRGYRFWFYEADLDEPPHVHVGHSGSEAKFWLDPIRFVRTRGFQPHELTEIERIIVEYQVDLLAAWAKERDKRANR